MHVDPFSNPSAQFADLLLPATTCWEREALLPYFDIAEDTMDWVQLRRPAVQPVGESRSEAAMIFALATRLCLGEHFFNGDLEAALNHQLAPSGLTTAQLRANPAGMKVPTATRYRKYAAAKGENGKPLGFATPSGKIEIYAKSFADAGYPPLPAFQSETVASPDFPLTLTFFRDIHYCDEQHRNISRLRRAVPEPFLEINPATAEEVGILNGDWLVLETVVGKVKLKAKFNEGLHPDVVATVYGWWQPCAELKLPGHDPFSPAGANANLLISNMDNDPISASVTHRGQQCRVLKR